MAGFISQVRLFGFDFKDFQFTVLLDPSIGAAQSFWAQSDLGLAVCFDPANPNQMKLSGAGDPIHGILEQVEVRHTEGTCIGLVSLAFADKLTIDPAAAGVHVVAVGSRLEGGATAGTVRAIDMTTAAPTIAQTVHAAAAPLVTELYSGTVAVALKFGL